jgi:putative tricarboxylic transport membrane protein
VGAYGIKNSYVDLISMAIFGIVGFFFRMLDLPNGPFILGLLLGKLLEANLRRTLAMTMGSYAIFINSPINVVLLLITVLSLFLPTFNKWRKVRKARSN